MTPVLEARGITAGYGRPVIADVDLAVEAGELVALLGANAAGKTTTLLALSGVLPLTAGEVRLAGEVTTEPLHRRARQGLAYAVERGVFKGMTAADNLRAADVEPAEALALFPELEPRMKVKAGLLSGGEQQMLLLARSLARRPRVLLVDELSLGLAPMVVERLLDRIRTAADERGVGVLLVEQYVRRALRHADRVYILRRGKVEMACSAEEATARIREIEGLYLTSAPGARS